MVLHQQSQRTMYTTTSAKTLDTELKELERRVTGPNLAIPQEYEQFANGLLIRSGNTRAQMRLYDYQRAISYLMDRYPTIMFTKSRQLGLTQVAATKLLHEAAKNKAYNSIFFSLTQQDLSSISRRISDSVENNRWNLCSEIDNISLQKIAGGGQISYRSYRSKSGSRGLDSVSTIAMDEVAWSDNMNELLGSAAASTVLVEKPNFVLITTPSTPGCEYYAMLEEALHPLHIEEVCEAVVAHKLFSFGIPGFFYHPTKDGMGCVCVVHWSAHPVFRHRDDFLKTRKSIERVSDAVLRREYQLVWQSSAGSYFTAAQINKTCILPPIGRAPRKDPRFEVVIGIDPAGGAQVSKKKSPDYCIAMVMIRDKVSRQVTQVGLYRDNRCTSAQHIKNLERLITVWNPDRVCVETVGLGGVFFSALKLTFPRLDLVPFATTARKKVTGYGRVAFLIDNGLLALWNSPPIKRELTELLDDGRGKIEAPQLGHDDIPVGIMLAVHALQHVDDENAD